MMRMDLKGDKEVILNLLAAKSDTFRRVREAIEKTAVRMANHARAGHLKGSNPHAYQRYENQTANLTNSIFPGGGLNQPVKWETVTEQEIVGLFGVNEAAPGAVMEYAPHVEERYPFIFPAAIENVERFKQEVANAAPK